MILVDILNVLLLFLLPCNYALKEDDQHDSPRALARSRSSGNSSFFKCGLENSTQTFCVVNRQDCILDPITNTSSCVCIAGWGGVNCLKNLDECSSEEYPCTGDRDLTSFCVDMDPPIRFKCGCLPGFTAILPNGTDKNVPVEYRPSACIPDKTTNPYATPWTSPLTITRTPIRSPTPPPTKARGTCSETPDCQGFLNNNFYCNERGICSCLLGFTKISANCRDRNECYSRATNNCHRNADCINTVGSFVCKCKDGYEDVNLSDIPGTKCLQVNECERGTHDCEDEESCIDRTPPTKWDCVDPTPAPTPSPTPSPTRCLVQGDPCSSTDECCACLRGPSVVCASFSGPLDPKKCSCNPPI